MKEFDDLPHRALAEHIKAFKQLPQDQQPDINVTVFDRGSDVLVPLTRVELVKEIPRYPTGHGTRLHATIADELESLIALSIEEMSEGRERPIALAVFTDGEDTSSPPGKHLPRLLPLVVEALDMKFQLIMVGIGVSGKDIAAEIGFPESLAMTVHPSGLNVLKAAADVTSMQTGHVTNMFAMDAIGPLHVDPDERCMLINVDGRLVNALADPDKEQKKQAALQRIRDKKAGIVASGPRLTPIPIRRFEAK